MHQPFETNSLHDLCSCYTSKRFVTEVLLVRYNHCWVLKQCVLMDLVTFKQRKQVITYPYSHVQPIIIGLHMSTVLCTHGHPSLHTWSPFSALMVTLLCTHGHRFLHLWLPLQSWSPSLHGHLCTRGHLCTHGHLCTQSPFSALMVTSALSHPFLHSWSPLHSVTLFCTHGHPFLHSWSPFSALNFYHIW